MSSPSAFINRALRTGTAGLQVGAGRQVRRAIYPGIPTSSGQTCGVRLDPGRPRHSLLHPTSRRRYSRRHDASGNLVVRCPHHPRPRSPSGRGRDRDGQRPRVEFVGQLGPGKALAGTGSRCRSVPGTSAAKSLDGAARTATWRRKSAGIASSNASDTRSIPAGTPAPCPNTYDTAQQIRRVEVPVPDRERPQRQR